MYTMLRFSLVMMLLAVTLVQSSVLTDERVKRQIPSFFDPFGKYQHSQLVGLIDNRYMYLIYTEN